ncbi:GNAT family N-acetyltransferase [Deinococcus sp.]|uniref:GNAT family N-acetyltransferase n=1 Tax=Deinococcus sp. TaxID=47478 RepID=UPI003B5A1F6E
MRKKVVERVTPETLEDFLAINTTVESSKSLNNRIENQSLTFDQMYILRSKDSTEAAFIVSPAPVVVPRIKFDISDDSMKFLAEELYKLLKDEDKILIIDSNLAPMNSNYFVNLGWKINDHSKIYETDLKNGSWKLDNAVEERKSSDLLSEDMFNLYEKLLTEDDFLGDTYTRDPREAFGQDALNDDVRLFVLIRDEEIIAAATMVSNPHQRIGIHLIGVLPSMRKDGLGQLIHSHVLAEGKKQNEFHVGGTNINNAAMHRIYLKNGAVMKAEHIQMTL